jgi:Protein of unknown function (DUF2786)
MKKRTTRREKIRKLRALARSPNKHEAALALEKAEQLEAKTIGARDIALAIGSVLEQRGLAVRVRRRGYSKWPLAEAEVRYYMGRGRSWSRGGRCVEIDVAVYE